MAIRTGERSFEEAIAEIDEVEGGSPRRSSGARCPSAPTAPRSTRFLVDAYRRAWGW